MKLLGLVYMVLTVPLILLTGCSQQVSNLIVVPGAGAQVLTGTGQTAQYRATATVQTGNATPITKDVTNSVTWTSSSPSVATINASGLATAVGAGTTNIIAEMNGQTATSDLTVTTSVSPNTPTLTIIPSTGAAITANVGETTQFIAIGDLDGSGVQKDVTNQVQWKSSDVEIATINQAGLATTVSVGNADLTDTIVALGTASNGSTITATSSLKVDSTGGPLLVPTVALYKVGVGQNWEVTSSPAGLNCGSAVDQTTCTGNFPIGTVVTLTAIPNADKTSPQNTSFGGWSVTSCAPIAPDQLNPAPSPPDPSNPSNLSLSCTVTWSTDNSAVGVIFNQQ